MKKWLFPEKDFSGKQIGAVEDGLKCLTGGGIETSSLALAE